MCGIVGSINHHNIVPDLLEGLNQIEYRGYDSAGIAVIGEHGLTTIKRPGKLKQLETYLSTTPLSGHAGIGHTRWATHGIPNEANAHPHSNDQVSVVHNGIIENYLQLRQWLTAEGFTFNSETDTEVIPHLITLFLARGLPPTQALHEALNHLDGAFALGVLFKNDKDHLYAARRGSPLVLGKGLQGLSLGSDTMALSSSVKEILYLEEGEQACLGRDVFTLFDPKGKPISREMQPFDQEREDNGKDDHQFFMHKEIHQQVATTRDTFHHTQHCLLDIPLDFEQFQRLTIVACGTSYYAAMVAKYWFEQIAKVPVDIDVASEFRYREPLLSKNGLALFISQSGETADTLAALRYAKANDQTILSIVNVAGSTIARESNISLQTQAGPEIGVASTKAFTAQLAILAKLAIHTAHYRKVIDVKEVKHLLNEMNALPGLIDITLGIEDQIKVLGASIKDAKHAFFIGRGINYPLAMEGALKLKEISYMHAEGFGAGELKHGPIALIEPGTPVFVIAPDDSLLEKTLSNAEEVAARGARCIIIGNQASIRNLPEGMEHLILPPCDNRLSPILYAVALQLIAYHAALALGTDVDQPRNLAKSVTVE
ncbi:glutamine--fructose-6-phosphate transaminase (isomerizing) [Neptuniibacter caesariensis]|uniref:Glutamine--fructose-6-phosphate aminotransferase [isomerizing] n=1 Tax=Neptuniibacter caesariensis TaxID=207954 RepID=A0A7U8C8U4_NEPCE|nr:glutamine--fructose-6-phosphate transaminase (isomerizing) [Neptuniibacter caesariensis]EAR62016.1 D-fructose-6-phosphate amidotransferase [Oceanospirillum sp. MED92] [Neptuniibacter caesariensis]